MEAHKGKCTSDAEVNQACVLIICMSKGREKCISNTDRIACASVPVCEALACASGHQRPNRKVPQTQIGSGACKHQSSRKALPGTRCAISRRY
jgi:hypothetical protein